MGRSQARKRGAHRILLIATCLSAAALPPACQTDRPALDEPLAAYRERMLRTRDRDATGEQAERQAGADRFLERQVLAQLAGSQSPQTRRAALLTEPDVGQVPAPGEILAQIPDPSEAQQVFAERLARIERTAREERVINQYRQVRDKALEYLADFYLPQQVELSLAECIRRALANNYLVRAEAHRPAISQARLVEAEAAFDAVFFLDTAYDNTDKLTSSELFGRQSDSRSYRGGLRQLLPTGLRAEVSLGQSRTFTDLAFATLNPAYESSFIAALTQPLLRGFGLDYNRSAINIARADYQISQETFLQRVRDTLLAVEQAYWQLVAARRAVLIRAETVAQHFVTYQSMRERQKHDATPVELNNSKARWQSEEVRFIEAIKAVRDAEDQLKNLLNDPELKLSEDIEIIPTETPLAAPLAIDHFREVRTALEQRSEIRQARLTIEKARIQTQRLKNETLPQLDLSFQYEVQGMGPNADNSFDWVTTNRYRSYSVSVNFAYPLGNRGARAAWRRARLEESQAVVLLKQQLDAVVEEVNHAVRQLGFRYKQVPPQLTAVQAAIDNLNALRARIEEVSPTYLETELSAVQQVATTRLTLLQTVTEYNLAIAQLEKAKGTLLEYNNVIVSDELASR